MVELWNKCQINNEYFETNAPDDKIEEAINDCFGIGFDSAEYVQERLRIMEFEVGPVLTAHSSPQSDTKEG
jgi:hypothetical protein